MQGRRAITWLLLWSSLCGCAPSPAVPQTPEPADEIELGLVAAVTTPARDTPLDSEIAALIGPEALAAAKRAPEAPPAELRTPAERAQEICEDRCAKTFDRDALIRRIVYTKPSSSSIEHGRPPDLSSDEGMRRFINGEPSTIWYVYGDPSNPGSPSYTLYINPELERARFAFHGLLFDIDEDDRVVRCRYAERGEPESAIEMACPRR